MTEYTVREGPIRCWSCGYESSYIFTNGKNEYLQCYTCGSHTEWRV